MRVELRDGQWAELRERIDHGSDKRIKLASLRAKRARDSGTEDEAAIFDWPTALVREFVRDWSVRDPDGNAIAIGDGDAIERAPEDLVDVLYEASIEAWTRATAPNSPTPPSSGGSSSASE